jgi:hypothetical protein
MPRLFSFSVHNEDRSLGPMAGRQVGQGPAGLEGARRKNGGSSAVVHTVSFGCEKSCLGYGKGTGRAPGRVASGYNDRHLWTVEYLLNT